MTDINYKPLYNKINYIFKNENLLKQALTHRSVSKSNNERFEFLGDSIVNFVIADALYKQFPKATEGELSRLRATLVKGDTLAKLAKTFELGPYLRLGMGELKSGGNYRESILADAVEAIIAAIYLDADIHQSQQCILTWYQTHLKELSITKSYKDPKTCLQEYLQSKQLALPVYEIDKVVGEAHKQVFWISCKAIDLTAQGSGKSRRKAEQAAAEALLAMIQDKEKTS